MGKNWRMYPSSHFRREFWKVSKNYFTDWLENFGKRSWFCYLQIESWKLSAGFLIIYHSTYRKVLPSEIDKDGPGIVPGSFFLYLSFTFMYKLYENILKFLNYSNTRFKLIRWLKQFHTFLWISVSNSYQFIKCFLYLLTWKGKMIKKKIHGLKYNIYDFPNYNAGFCWKILTILQRGFDNYYSELRVHPVIIVHTISSCHRFQLSAVQCKYPSISARSYTLLAHATKYIQSFGWLKSGMA